MKRIKALLEFVKSYILIFIIPFLFVNILEYPTEKTISINFSNIYNIFNWPIIIDQNGLLLYVSIITILSLLVVLIQWQKQEKSQRLSDINGLVEELKHNINILGNIFIECNYDEMYRAMSKELDKTEATAIYPNPTDGDWQTFKYIHYIRKKPSLRCTIVPLRDQFINTIISSRQIFNIDPQRIFLNIGHLKYSIDRHNRNIAENNKARDQEGLWIIAFDYAQEEYIKWLHFRLHYLLIDIMKNVTEKDIIDKRYYDEIIKKIK